MDDKYRGMECTYCLMPLLSRSLLLLLKKKRKIFIELSTCYIRGVVIFIYNLFLFILVGIIFFFSKAGEFGRDVCHF